MFIKREDIETVELDFPVQTALAAEKMLDNRPVGTYVLRTDPCSDKYLSGVHSDGLVHHARLEWKSGILFGFNAEGKGKMTYKAHTVAELAPLALHCDPDQCQLIYFETVQEQGVPD